MTTGELAELLGAELKGDENLLLEGVAALDVAEENELSFITDRRYKQLLEETRAGCILMKKESDFGIPEGKTVLLVEEVEDALERAAEALLPSQPEYPKDFVSPYADISPEARIGSDCYVGPFCIVEKGAVIGDGAVLVGNLFVGEDAVVGDETLLYPGVFIGARCRIGKRVIIHANAVVGSDGFGFRQKDGEHIKLPQRGIVVVEDDVEIGAGVCIDRARFDRTVIGAGTKIDNLVHIAHNVRIGKRCLLIAQVGIAGSARIGNGVIIAGQAGIDGHIRIGDRVVVAGKAGVTKSLPDGITVAGYPAQEHIKEKRIRALRRRLPELVRRIERLERILGSHRDVAEEPEESR